jgi:hypothetical protein
MTEISMEKNIVLHKKEYCSLLHHPNFCHFFGSLPPLSLPTIKMFTAVAVAHDPVAVVDLTDHHHHQHQLELLKAPLIELNNRFWIYQEEAKGEEEEESKGLSGDPTMTVRVKASYWRKRSVYTALITSNLYMMKMLEADGSLQGPLPAPLCPPSRFAGSPLRGSFLRGPWPSCQRVALSAPSVFTMEPPPLHGRF